MMGRQPTVAMLRNDVKEIICLKDFMAVVGHYVLGEDLGLLQLYAAETVQT